MKRYNPKDFEKKWQLRWEEDGIYHVNDADNRPKKYVMEFFPYPSGAAMHVGHVRNYTIGDALARYYRMLGNNVLHPMGWDAFGLPAENFAIKNNVSPRIAIDQNTLRFKQQLLQMGFGYDWSREINSTDPKYYKWTQWFFLLLYKRGLAYQKESLQWWCPVDKTVLANEQVEAGLCWRCGSRVEKKALRQWFFKISEYADRLLDDLDGLDWSDAIKSMQRNWIGRSRGVSINFTIDNFDTELQVFTTRPDTIFGATFLVLAPEHEVIDSITTKEKKEAVGAYIRSIQTKSEIERQETNHSKTGVFTGAYAINPINNKKIPIWVADYVLTSYGTGAIMAVPAHDQRDWDFAKKFNLPIIRVIDNDELEDACSVTKGISINSGRYNGLTSDEASEQIIDDLKKSNKGQEIVNYKIRDWLISRQRYWGAPIPIVHCPVDGAVAVPEEQLPVKLPELKNFEPSGDGHSPLAKVPEFLNTTCPKCGGPAERETDTMDGFACSSWYFLRFADPRNSTKPFREELVQKWLPVDEYVGGAEHAVMHLLYARFWTKVMFDEGLIKFTEPFTTLRNHGMILAPDGNKMSKSKGNTIEPDGLIDSGYGADSIRLMELFIGPWNQVANWSVEGMGGAFRFMQRVWRLLQDYIDSEKTVANSADIPKLNTIQHKTIKKVTEDFKQLSFNTAIASLMEYVNVLYKIKEENGISKTEDWESALVSMLKLLAPIAPHITEELWSQLGEDGSIHVSAWPEYIEDLTVDSTFELIVQINGKLKHKIPMTMHTPKEKLLETVLSDRKVKDLIAEKSIVKTIVVPNKLVNLVI